MNKQQLKYALEVIVVPFAAAIVLIEQILIRYLNFVTAAFARWAPIAWLEARLVRLPPWAAVLVFAGPSILILPIKLSALYFGAHRHYCWALAAVIFGKVLATAIVARLYRILRPTLLSLGWFAWADHRFFHWRDWAYDFVRSLPAWRKAVELIERVKSRLMVLVAGLFAR